MKTNRFLGFIGPNEVDSFFPGASTVYVSRKRALRRQIWERKKKRDNVWALESDKPELLDVFINQLYDHRKLLNL